MVKCKCKLFRELIYIKIFRRSIIGICTFILVISWLHSFPESKYYDNNLKSLVEEGNAQVIEVGKGLKLDNDTLYIRRIINTNDKTYIRYSYFVKEVGWSFPNSCISIIDDKGKIYQGHGGGASGKMWGQDGLISFERVNNDAKQLTIKLDWYDRKDQMTVSLEKAGAANED